MRVKELGKYTIVSDIIGNKGRNIRQLYKNNRMIQLTEDKRFVHRVVVDTSTLKSLYISLKDKVSGLIKVIKDTRK